MRDRSTARAVFPLGMSRRSSGNALTQRPGACARPAACSNGFSIYRMIPDGRIVPFWTCSMVPRSEIR